MSAKNVALTIPAAPFQILVERLNDAGLSATVESCTTSGDIIHTVRGVGYRMARPSRA